MGKKKKSRATVQRLAARAANLDANRPALLLNPAASAAINQPTANSITVDKVTVVDEVTPAEAAAYVMEALITAAVDMPGQTAAAGSTLPTPTLLAPTALNQTQPALGQAANRPPSAVPLAVEEDELFEQLSTLLVGEQRQQLAQMRLQVEQLQRMIDELEVQINDEEALVSTITPVIASAIRTNITESRDEMIDALYPIMGKLVQRSVTEAMRDLARRIDEQMRRTFDFKALWHQLFARMRGVSNAEMAMRNAFPFQVLQIFLIHRETGLLLMHCAQQSEETTDSDLISSMLTAIRDFTEDAFGRGQEAELNEIQYGDRSILIEVAHLVYLAVVIQGVLGSGFRAQMRETMITIEHQHTNALRTYDGDVSRFVNADEQLRALLVNN